MEERKEKLTQTEWLKKYLVEPDDVPKELNEVFWSVTSRHLELIYIPNYKELKRYRWKVRDIIRTTKWGCRRRRFIDYGQERQLEFYACDILLPKSVDRGERELQATEIKELRTSDNENPPSKGIRASLGKIFGGG